MDAALRETRTPALPDFLAAGDLLIVNDAATVPASLRGRDDAGNEIEARLIAARADDRFSAVLFGAGDWHQRTEDRPPPAALPVGARLRFGALVAEIAARAPASPRLVDAALRRRRRRAVGRALPRGPARSSTRTSRTTCRCGPCRPSTPRAPGRSRCRPPGGPLSWEILLALRRKGVRWASLTHAAGLSATGDPAIDAALPLAERYEIPAATVRAVTETRARGGRVVAVGTTVVRALEGAAR